jgi:hypothetical protein
MGTIIRRKAVLCALLAIGNTSNVWAAVTEDDLALVEDEINTIKESLDTATKLSGYVDAEYINDSRGSATLNQAGEKYGFRMHHLSLFVTKKFNSDWKFFSEIEFEDGVLQDGLDQEANYGAIFAEAINIDYQWHPSQYVRIGRDFTPAGIWSIDHYPPFVPTQEMPLHIRQIFPQVVDGIDSHGTIALGTTFMNYNVYVANGDGTPGESDNNNRKAIGTRLSFILPKFQHFEIGASVFKDTDPYNYTGDPSISVAAKKTAYGVHGKLKIKKLTLQTEYATDTQKPLDGSPQIKQVGYYLQGYYDIRRWSLGYRYDFWDEDQADANKVTDNVAFVNYHVNPSIVFKLEHHIVSNKDTNLEDYQRTILSIAYYLGE